MTDLLIIRIVLCASLPKVFYLATLHIWSLFRHCPTACFVLAYGIAASCIFFFVLLGLSSVL